ncbi:MAG: hypothetical protein RL385_279 [Pseudomonadota bacterium]|jgi:hypothetical protein
MGLSAEIRCAGAGVSTALVWGPILVKYRPVELSHCVRMYQRQWLHEVSRFSRRVPEDCLARSGVDRVLQFTSDTALRVLSALLERPRCSRSDTVGGGQRNVSL